MKPQDPPTAKATFGAVIETAMSDLATYRETYNHAYDLGVCPDDILAYAKGELRGSERKEMEEYILRSPWVANRVVALVKAFRSTGREILLPRAGEVSDHILEGLKLLDSI